MERRVQTRHSTGAVRERRVWNFSSRKQQNLQESEIESAKKANNKQVKKKLQSTEKHLKDKQNGVGNLKKGLVPKASQRIKENVEQSTVATRQKRSLERSDQIDFDSKDVARHSESAETIKDTNQLKRIKRGVNALPPDNVTKGNEIIKRQKIVTDETDIATSRQKTPSQRISKSHCKDQKSEENTKKIKDSTEKAVENTKKKHDDSLQEPRLVDDKPTRFMLQEENDQDNGTQESLKVVIPVGGESSLGSEITDVLKKSRENVTKYSLNARHVGVVQGEIVEVDGERLVKLPSTEDDCIIMIAVSGRRKVVDEVSSSTTFILPDTAQVKEKDKDIGIDNDEEPCDAVVSACSEEKDDNDTVTVIIEPSDTNEKYSQTFSDSEQEDMMDNSQTSEDINKSLDDFSEMAGVLVKNEIDNTADRPLEADTNPQREFLKSSPDIKEDGTSASYNGEEVENECPPELSCKEENEDQEVNLNDVSKLENSSIKTEIFENSNQQKNGDRILKTSTRRRENSNLDQQKSGVLKMRSKRRDRQVRAHQCLHCSKKFYSKRDLAIHTRIHTGEKPYSCSFCNKAFTQKSVLTNHTRTHTGEKPYICDVCGKAFADPTTLRVHTRFHTGERPYKCKFCDKKFANNTACKDHMTVHTGEKKFVCHLCGKAFRTSMMFNSHFRVHTGEKRYACKVCDKTFHSTRNRRRHMAVHTGNRKYFMCDICGKNISSSTNFAKHRKIHLTEKPHVCDICDKRFRDKKCYMNHLQAHTERVPHVCPECGKSFVKLSHMKRHMISHKQANGFLELSSSSSAVALEDDDNSKKTFACNFCGKRYKDRQCFKKHYLQHPEAQNVIFKCVICEKQFATLAFLEEHVATHENFETNEVVYITSDDVDKVFTCGICEENFEGIKKFEEHLQIHSEDVALVQSDLIEGAATNVEQTQVAGFDSEDMVMIKVEGSERVETEQQGEQIQFIEQVEDVKHADRVEYHLQQTRQEEHEIKHADQVQDPESETHADQKNQQVDYADQVEHVIGGAVENVKHPGEVENVEHVGALGNFDHLGQVEHIEQVVMEDGQSVQTIVYVTVGEEEVKTVE